MVHFPPSTLYFEKMTQANAGFALLYRFEEL
jgi:hypothetical protein